MAQPTISAMENAGYEGFTLSTLKKIASGFDVGLLVRFVPYGDLVHWADNFSPDTFTVPSADTDPVLNAPDESISRDATSGFNWMGRHEKAGTQDQTAVPKTSAAEESDSYPTATKTEGAMSVLENKPRPGNESAISQIR